MGIAPDASSQVDRRLASCYAMIGRCGTNSGPIACIDIQWQQLKGR